jgi:sigma-B regulation protein RsbU (phosphoserine phosphatase)
MTAHPYEGPEELVKATLKGVESFARGAEQSDDITLLSLQLLRQPTGKTAQSLEITLSNRLEEIDRVNEEVEHFAEEHGIDRAVLMQLKLVFDELLNNIISYGFDDEDEHEIEVKVDLLEGRLLVTISDDGIPFNPFLRETPDLSLSIEEREIGGLGIHLVRNVMDEVSYKRRVDRNVVTMIKFPNGNKAG